MDEVPLLLLRFHRLPSAEGILCNAAAHLLVSLLQYCNKSNETVVEVIGKLMLPETENAYTIALQLFIRPFIAFTVTTQLESPEV